LSFIVNFGVHFFQLTPDFGSKENEVSFVEIEFKFFLPVVLLLYWVVPRRAGAQNLVLLVASYLFYATWHWKLLSILVLGTLIDYLVGRYLGRNPEAPRRRLALSISLIYSLGALAFFKYEDFFASQINLLLQGFGLSPSVPLLHLALPLGISFYTLQRVGYILDVYWGRQAPCQSLVELAVFCAFFPQLTAGPISRARELLPQLSAARRLEPQKIADGALAFLTGFALAALAAKDIGARLVDPVFADPGAFTAASLWAGVAGYALQVFGDFAGYSLMAIGAARFFGIELPVNFNFPFLSRSLPELWRRWHITLNRWLFDFIFTPLTTSRGWFRGRIGVALMITFLASGLWHGASWTFVTWGFLHGVGMVVNYRWDEYYRSLCRRDRTYVKKRQAAIYQIGAWLLTMFFFIVTLVPFRAPDGGTALNYALGMLTPGRGQAIGFSGRVAAAVIIILGYHLIQMKPFDSLRERFFMLPSPLRGVAYGLVIMFLIVATPSGPGTFIYQLF
jgi:alginate O-acetyltransferase complex protein AlgI